MNLDFFIAHTKMNIRLYKQQSVCGKFLKTSPKTVEKISQDNTKEFEDYMNEEYKSKLNKCLHCKIEMQIFSPTAVECPKYGLADTKLLMKDYHKFTNSYLEPSKQIVLQNNPT